jgi:hypothetical protein
MDNPQYPDDGHQRLISDVLKTCHNDKRGVHTALVSCFQDTK